MSVLLSRSEGVGGGVSVLTMTSAAPRGSWGTLTREAEVGGGGEGLGVGELALGAAEALVAGEPELDGGVVVLEDGAQGVGAIAAEPGLLVEVAEERIAVDEVAETAVDAADVRELGGGLAVVAGDGGGLGSGVALGDFVGQLELEAYEVEAAGA